MRFKQTALRFMINYLSKQEIQDIKEHFQKLDIEHNGVITYNDLKQELLKTGKTNQEIQEIFENIELEESDFINFSDFIVATLDRKKYINEQFLTEVF